MFATSNKNIITILTGIESVEKIKLPQKSSIPHCKLTVILTIIVYKDRHTRVSFLFSIEKVARKLKNEVE
jgi:hypothetical protein